MKLKQLPKTELPREKLIKYGKENLSDSELLALILKTGTKEENIMELSLNILNKINLEKNKYLFDNIKQEHFYCLYLNTKKEIIERKLLFMGTLNKSIVHPREIFKEAYKLSASSIVCIHNHSSGDPTPSSDDIM